MIPALPPAPSQSSSRSWWSRSSSSKSANNERLSGTSSSKPPGPKKLNLASVIGLKSKRPALAIQEPPSPVLPLHTGDIDSPPRSYTNRPPAKSVSTVHSWEDSLEPRTPQSDGPVGGKHLSYQQSVLTTSEMDPFAAQYPGNIRDPSRLSVFSDASTSDSHMRKNELSSVYNRLSYASSSEQSHQLHPDSSHMPSPHLLPDSPGGWRASRLTVESEKIVRRESPFFSSSSTPTSPSRRSSANAHDRARIPTSPSSTTLTDKVRPIETAVPSVPRPKTRPRGLTDVGPAPHRKNSVMSDTRLLPSAYPPTAIATDSGPRVIVRQPSINSIHRLQPLQPPFAPPTAGLPPTPLVTDLSHAMSASDRLREPSPSSAASSSSSLSFASSVSSNRDAVANYNYSKQRTKESNCSPNGRSPSQPRGRDKTPGHSATPSTSSRREFSPARTLKKAISTQSLSRRSIAASASSSPASTIEDSKSVKKQRSFHHSRIPLPPLPASLRYTNAAPNGGPSLEELPVMEQRRASVQSSTQSPPVRKRLFSGPTSLRRSTSSQAQSMTDDDGRSVFSLSPEDRAGPLQTPVSTVEGRAASFWDDGLEPPASPGGTGIVAPDYTPQHIMSPSDMLKLEALVQDGRSTVGFVRSRGDSFTSVSTSMSNAFSDNMSSEMSPISPASPPSAMRYPDRFATVGGRYVGGRHSQQPPSRNDSLLARALGSVSLSSGRPNTAQGNMTASTSPDRSSFLQPLAAFPGLPVPPRSRVRPATATGASRTSSRTSFVPVVALSPPPARRNTARRSNVPDPIVPRHSIMRKPSFLDIDDEAGKDRPPAADSFLDMGKVSFDTVRSSMDEDFALH